MSINTATPVFKSTFVTEETFWEECRRGISAPALTNSIRVTVIKDDEGIFRLWLLITKSEREAYTYGLLDERGNPRRFKTLDTVYRYCEGRGLGNFQVIITGGKKNGRNK